MKHSKRKGASKDSPFRNFTFSPKDSKPYYEDWYTHRHKPLEMEVYKIQKGTLEKK